VKKIIYSLFFLIILCHGAVLAEGPLLSEQDAAIALHQLDLFQGSGTGFELERVPTRLEGILMLLRLTGQEEAASACRAECPFNDVPAWGLAYVTYAYSMKLTSGISKMEFGSAQLMTSNQYLTLLLRALGYSDADGDFNWQDPYPLMSELGLIIKTDPEEVFTRGDVVDISWKALKVNIKGTAETLAEKLIEFEVFTQERYQTATASIQDVREAEFINNDSDLQMIADHYQVSLEKLHSYMDEISRFAKESGSKLNISVWIQEEIDKIKERISAKGSESYDQMVRWIWDEFWDEVDGKPKEEIVVSETKNSQDNDQTTKKNNETSKVKTETEI